MKASILKRHAHSLIARLVAAVHTLAYDGSGNAGAVLCVKGVFYFEHRIYEIAALAGNALLALLLEDFRHDENLILDKRRL